MVANCIRDRFQQKDYIFIRKAALKALREKEFGHELQQMSLLLNSGLDKFKLETQRKTLTDIVD